MSAPRPEHRPRQDFPQRSHIGRTSDRSRHLSHWRYEGDARISRHRRRATPGWRLFNRRFTHREHRIYASSEGHSVMTLVRSPMLSQATRVVAQSDVSFNTELSVIRKLSRAAQEATKLHGVILMVELGDLREGIMPADLEETVRETLRFPNIAFKGIGTNLACRSGVSPDATKMAQLSALAVSVEEKCGHTVEIVSGGNSANLQWALGGERVGRINDLRLGESILLGREPLHRKPIDGLHTNAITLTAEVMSRRSSHHNHGARSRKRLLGRSCLTRIEATFHKRFLPLDNRTRIRAASLLLRGSKSSGPAATT